MFSKTDYETGKRDSMILITPHQIIRLYSPNIESLNYFTKT